MQSLDDAEQDELDLFPGGLELPPMRSPRGSIHSLYGVPAGSNCSSRRNSSQARTTNMRASSLIWDIRHNAFKVAGDSKLLLNA
jgi:hypothetical protein